MYLKLRGIRSMGEGSANEMKETRVTLVESSSSRSMKRSRIPGNGAQVPSCLVDGCNSDLSKCRNYHRRHKVCELHSKTPKVTISGKEQRFCQQCSRFHSLAEFDDRKRSCRKRLDGHNRRRRKPQPASMLLNTGRFLLSNQELVTSMCKSPRFLPFGTQLLQTSDNVSSSWIGTVKPETTAVLNGSSSFEFPDRRKNMLQVPASLVSNYRDKQLAFSHIPIGVLPKSEAGQPFLDASFGSSNGENAQKALTDGINRFFESECALSLLSTPVEAGEIHLSSMVQSNQLIPQAHYNIHGNGLAFESDPVSSGLVSDAISYSTFQTGADGSTPTGPYQTLSFTWD